MLHAHLRSLAFAKTKLVKEAQHELPVLKYMLRIDVLNGVVGCVDVRVAILESGLKDKRSGVSVPSSGTVVRASVAAHAIHTLDVCVLDIG